LVRGGYIGQRICAVLETKMPPILYIRPDNRKHRYWMRKKFYDSHKRYEFHDFNPVDHAESMYAINTSMPERCGYEMTDSYKRSPEELKKVYGGSKPIECCYHWAKWYGAFYNGALVAYILLRRLGNMAFYSMLLGHGDHLKHGVMFGLHYHVYRLVNLMPTIDFIMYGDWRDGGKGMQFWKKRCRFKPTILTEAS